MLAYGFNHDAAERSFLKATELDPDCSMCWWGAALVLGPHVNSDMEPANNAKAWTRLQTAAAMTAFFFVLRGGGCKYGEMPGAADPLYL